MKSYLLIVGTLIVVISALITLNVFFQQSLQMDMAEQFNKQQLLLSKSIADSIKTYLYFIKQNVLHLSNMLSKQHIDNKKELHWLTDTSFRKKGIIETSLGIIDNKGSILFFDGDINILRPVIGDISKKAKNLGPNSTTIIETYYTVYIISSVYNMNTVRGIVFLSIKIDDLARNFVSDIKSGTRGYAWIIDKDGTLLYHPTQPGMVGGNIYRAGPDCFKCHVNFDLEKKILEGKAENFGRYIAPSGEDKVIAFSAVSIDNLSWIIAVSAPYSEVTSVTRHSMKLYSYLIISIFITTSIISTLLIVFNKKRIKAEEVAKRKEELEKYAVELENRVNERTAELISEKEKLNTIVSTIGGGIVLLDNRGKIKWSNKKIVEMVGHEIVGMSCEDLCSDCSILFDTKSKDINTAIMSNLFGQKGKYFQVTNAPIKGINNEVHGYIRFIQDVTEIKKMEEQIIHSEKLASIGRLAAGIAHEIGNPLTSIFSFVQILREMEDDEFKKESLETIYFHINRISEILKQLSGFSKMPVGEPKECQINEIIEASTNLIQYDKKAKNINIVKELSPSLPLITIDGNQLSQVFVNLTLNAIDAMPDGGTLTIKSMMRKDNIVIQFKDTGTGIAQEELPKIFDPFYTTKEKGTGLGLAVSYNIIKKMNGTLTVESELGKGTTFIITIPISAPSTERTTRT
ncbi:sensor histidine kinase [Dissulfurispira thermophila]|nr:PAS domain-containing sensor histidine kinase [Dissulfurispira thermophila]